MHWVVRGGCQVVSVCCMEGFLLSSTLFTSPNPYPPTVTPALQQNTVSRLGRLGMRHAGYVCTWALDVCATLPLGLDILFQHQGAYVWKHQPSNRPDDFSYVHYAPTRSRILCVGGCLLLTALNGAPVSPRIDVVDDGEEGENRRYL